jgi:ABC-type transport system involved in multi-copper enzyme maturation permease subunit
VRRWEVVVGKWLGLAGMVAVFTFALGSSLVFISWRISGHALNQPFAGLSLITLQGIVILSLSLLGGTRLSTLTNGVLLFMLYGLSFIASWIEQIGAFIPNQAAVYIGIVVSLFLPMEVLWRLATVLMQPPILGAMGVGPFMTMSRPSTLMAVYAAAYALVMLVLAVWSFNRRDV